MKKLPLICAASLALVLSACTNNIKEKMSYAENKENKISSKNLPFYFFENSPKLREDGNPLVDLYTLENNQPKKIASNLDSNDDGFRVTNSMESSYYYIDNKKKLFKISAENNT
ncbi:MAG: hypothetical protein KBT36_10355, partial [Kurthia sp.]|nr:hypothetical protein [Candidatus Kurthia equi]